MTIALHRWVIFISLFTCSCDTSSSQNPLPAVSKDGLQDAMSQRRHCPSGRGWRQGLLSADWPGRAAPVQVPRCAASGAVRKLFRDVTQFDGGRGGRGGGGGTMVRLFERGDKGDAPGQGSHPMERRHLRWEPFLARRLSRKTCWRQCFVLSPVGTPAGPTLWRC